MVALAPSVVGASHLCDTHAGPTDVRGAARVADRAAALPPATAAAAAAATAVTGRVARTSCDAAPRVAQSTARAAAARHAVTIARTAAVIVPEYGELRSRVWRFVAGEACAREGMGLDVIR